MDVQHLRTLRLPAVLRRVGKCRASVYNAIRAGQFPKPIRLGPNTVGWVESEIDAYLAAKIAERDAPMLKRIPRGGLVGMVAA